MDIYAIVSDTSPPALRIHPVVLSCRNSPTPPSRQHSEGPITDGIGGIFVCSGSGGGQALPAGLTEYVQRAGPLLQLRVPPPFW